MTFVHLVLFVVASAAITLGSWRLAARLRHRRLLETAIVFIGLLYAHVLVISFVVGGVLGMYTPIPLTIAAAAIVAAELRWLRQSPRINEDDRRLRARLRLATRTVGSALRQRRLLIVLAALVGVQYLWRLVFGLRLPITDWDGLSYRFIAPDTWIQSGEIGRTTQSLYADGLPLNIEAVMAWPGVFLHTMRFATLAQLPLYLLGALAVVGLARRVRVGRAFALLAGLLFLAMPIVFNQAMTTYGDVATAACLVAALYLVTGLRSATTLGLTPADAMLAYGAGTGVLLGIAAGSDLSSLGLVPFLLVAVLFYSYRWWRGARAWRGALRSAAYLMLPTLALGSYWYVRNAFEHDNPFHPISYLGFRGLGSFHDMLVKANEPAEVASQNSGVNAVFASWVTDLFPHSGSYDSHLGGFGLVWFVILIPCAVAAVVFHLRSSRGPVVFLVAAAVTVMATTPAQWWSRYTLVFAAIICALAVPTLASIAKLNTRRVIATGLAAATGVAMYWASTPTLLIKPDESPDPMSLSSAAAAMFDGDLEKKIYPWNEYQFADDFPDGSRIGVLATERPAFTHVFVGTNLKRELVVVDRAGDLDSLRQRLTDIGVDYLVISEKNVLTDGVLLDRRHFQALPGPSEDSKLFVLRFGDFPTFCPTQGTKVVANVSTQDSRKVEAIVTDDCGRPLGHLPLEIWTVNKSTGAQSKLTGRVAARTNSEGNADLTVPAEFGPVEVFLRYKGSRYLEPAASSVLDIEDRG